MIFNLISALVSTATDATAENPEIMSDIQLETLISDLAFILILGAVVTVLFKWLKQPVVLGYIVAGFLASRTEEHTSELQSPN